MAAFFPPLFPQRLFFDGDTFKLASLLYGLCIYKIFSFFDKCKKKLCILSNLQAIIFTISFLIGLNTLSELSYFFVSLLKAA